LKQREKEREREKYERYNRKLAIPAGEPKFTNINYGLINDTQISVTQNYMNDNYKHISKASQYVNVLRLIAMRLLVGQASSIIIKRRYTSRGPNMTNRDWSKPRTRSS
jgi:hypothetical protein